MARQRTAEGRAIAKANLRQFRPPRRDYQRSGAHVTITQEALDERVRMIEASVTEGSGGWLQPADKMVLEILAETRMHLSNIAQSGVISKWFRQQATTRGKRAVKTPAVVETWYKLLGRALDVADALLLTPAARMRVLGSRVPSSQIKDLSGLLALAGEDDPNRLRIDVKYSDDWRTEGKPVTSPEAPPASSDTAQDVAAALRGASGDVEHTEPPAVPAAPVPDAPAETVGDRLLEQITERVPAADAEDVPPPDAPPRREGWPWA